MRSKWIIHLFFQSEFVNFAACQKMWKIRILCARHVSHRALLSHRTQCIARERKKKKHVSIFKFQRRHRFQFILHAISSIVCSVVHPDDGKKGAKFVFVGCMRETPAAGLVLCDFDFCHEKSTPSVLSLSIHPSSRPFISERDSCDNSENICAPHCSRHQCVSSV